MAQETKTKNAQQLIYGNLRASILSLNLVPGTMISENEISQRFKVSRTPVREAFIALSKESLVTVMPQKGSMVSRIDFARVEQEFFLRKNLEAAALKQFVKNHNPSHLEELEKLIELQAEACEAKKFEQFFRYDNLFHEVFFNEQNLAWEAIENTCGHYHRVRLLTLWLLDTIKELVEDHKRLFQAVKQRDSKKALALLDAHIHKLSAEGAMLERLFPDYFNDSREIPNTVDFGGINFD